MTGILAPRSSAHTHQGHKRKQNQDSLHMDDGHGLWIVADGMGGHQGGEIASAIACEVIPEQVSTGVGIAAALQAAHGEILVRGNRQRELLGMGTTVVVVREQGNDYELAWSGDSRIYRWRNGQLSQCSEDHSVVQRLLKSGLLTEQQARNHPHQHVISSCLGSTADEGLEIGYRREHWFRHDWLLLCSDGLTDELDDEQIAAILAQHDNVTGAGAALLQAALDAGGRDNVSVALIRAPDDAPQGRLSGRNQGFFRRPFCPWLLAIGGVLVTALFVLT